MKSNIKTYRYLANVVKEWYDAYKVDNGLMYMHMLQDVFNSKMNAYTNPYKQKNLENEIIRLIGRKSFTILKCNYITKSAIKI